jgi:hypothetical protein
MSIQRIASLVKTQSMVNLVFYYRYNRFVTTVFHLQPTMMKVDLDISQGVDIG